MIRTEAKACASIQSASTYADKAGSQRAVGNLVLQILSTEQQEQGLLGTKDATHAECWEKQHELVSEQPRGQLGTTNCCGSKGDGQGVLIQGEGRGVDPPHCPAVAESRKSGWWLQEEAQR